MSATDFTRTMAGILGGGGLDADVTAYATAVATAGGTLPAAHQAALNAAMPALKASGAWALIKEMWLPLGANGDLVTMKVKLKNGATSPTLTPNNLVAGDYTVATGLDFGSTASNKSITTDFAPQTNGGLAAAEWGMSAYITRDLTNAGAIMGMTSNTTAYLHYGGVGAGGENRLGNSLLTLVPNGSTEQFLARRLVTAQCTGGTQYAYYGGWVKNSASLSTPALPAGTFQLGSINSAFFANAAVSGYAVHAPMTPAQLRALQTFYDNVCTAIGRTIFGSSLNAIGDSYTAATPQGPSDAAHDYVAVAATSLGWSYSLQGVSGRGWATANTGQSKMTDTNGRVGRDAVFVGMLNAPTKHALLCLGLNDARYGTATGLGTGAGTDGLLQTEMMAILDMLVAQGYPMQYVMLGTGYWASDVTNSGPGQTVSVAVANVQKALASSYGTRVCDFYSGQSFGRTDVEAADHLHKTDAGHALLANDLIAAAAGW